MITSDIYIIKTSPYRESSNLYEAIVKDIGKVSLIHKGIKANKKRNSLELFTPYRVNWSGKGNIKFLRESEVIKKIDFSPTQNILGMYFNELMYYLTKNDYQIEKLYDHYSASLLNLLKSKNFLISLNDYEIGLLILTGHYIVFDIDSDDKTIDINEKYQYVPDLGPKLSLNIRDAYMGKTMMALSGLHSYDTESVKESRVLMKRLIDYYIQPKKIKTREILRYITL